MEVLPKRRRVPKNKTGEDDIIAEVVTNYIRLVRKHITDPTRAYCISANVFHAYISAHLYSSADICKLCYIANHQ